MVMGYSCQLPSPLFFASTQERAESSFPDRTVFAGDLNRTRGRDVVKSNALKVNTAPVRSFKLSPEEWIWSF